MRKLYFLFLLPLWFWLTSCSAQEVSLKEGDQAPDFTLPSDEGKLVKLSDFKGHNVVLYFYPKDQTPGCTKEACSMRDNLGSIKGYNSVVLGVSVDNVDAHKAFKEKDHLTFTLLSDADKSVSKQYSGLNALGMSKRVTYVIDSNGVIRKIFTKVDVASHYKDVIAVLAGLH